MTDTDAEPDTTDDAAESDSADLNGNEDLIARVASVDESLAAEVADLAERAASLEADRSEKADRIEELESSLKRTKADFQNYKKRTENEKERIKARATEDLVERLIDVRDNLVRALEQDENADIRDGVEATLSTFDRVLADENVEAIHPEPGEEVDPNIHEVMMQVEGDQPEGHIQDIYRPGYRMDDKVLQVAQVTVSEGPEDESNGDDDAEVIESSEDSSPDAEPDGQSDSG